MAQVQSVQLKSTESPHYSRQTGKSDDLSLSALKALLKMSSATHDLYCQLFHHQTNQCTVNVLQMLRKYNFNSTRPI